MGAASSQFKVEQEWLTAHFCNVVWQTTLIRFDEFRFFVDARLCEESRINETVRESFVKLLLAGTIVNGIVCWKA